MFHTIYQTTNNVNGKIYIGVHSTLDIHDSYLGSGKNLKRAIKKHGKENFKKEILHIVGSIEEAYNIEEKIVNEDFISRDDTYNVKIGGDRGPRNAGKNNPMYGKKHSLETRAKNSEARKGQHAGEKHPLYGIGHSQEAKEKIRQARQNTTHSDETKKKMSESHLGKTPWNKGRILSEETRKKMSERAKDRWTKLKN
jgi:group I intron endonuclease